MSRIVKRGDRLFCLVESDPVLGRGSFRPNHPGQLLAPDGLTVLDASRLPDSVPDTEISAALAEGRLTVVNVARPDWERMLAAPKPGKKRVHILAMGDVGSTLLMGLKLLGGDVIDRIGICDISEKITARWEFEMGQVSLPWDYGAMPEVEIVPPERIFDCDVFVFVASRGIPPVGSRVRDVRMAQLEANAPLVKHYARLARAAHFRGLWAAVSDPVDPLARIAYLESNRDDVGRWDGLGLLPEQVQGYGLGVMNARAAYYAKRDARFASFLADGRSFGPHGEGLWIANSLSRYDEELSRELTELTVTANLRMRELGFKPYVAPALSSGALSLLLTLRGEWHCGSVFLDGVYMGCKNRFTPAGLETELLETVPDALFAHLQDAAEKLKEIG
ncbi:MAG: lactate dehydrogenase [Oscillospiraceae bacterium]|nr:lactate dehydrogenase [Oscillospiraceae bacterium]